jgi:hypothetical protein
VDLPEARRCGGATLGGRVGYVCDEVAAMVDGGVVAGFSSRRLWRRRGR